MKISDWLEKWGAFIIFGVPAAFMALIVFAIIYGAIFKKPHKLEPIIDHSRSCAEISSFDNLSKRVMSYYGETTMRDYEVTGFYDKNSHLIDSTAFLRKETLNDDDHNEINIITLKNGRVYRIRVLYDGGCTTRAHSDSVTDQTDDE